MNIKRSWLITGVGVVALLAASVVLPDQPGFPIAVTLRGAIIGIANGLLAVGLVLTYRTTRIINFAYGAMGGVGGGLAAALSLGKGWPWLVSAAIGVAAGVVVGAMTERFVIRRFINAPRLVLTVATIGLAQLLGGIALFMPGWFGAADLIPGFDTSLSDKQWTIEPVTFNGNDLLLVAVVPLVLAGLVWFLKGTDAGTAVRGMAENMDRARLVGIPVNQLSLLLWSIAGGLAALAVVLKAPNQGVSFDAAAGPSILLPALAAAVVTGMRSMPAAFVAGTLIGVADQVVAWNVERRATTYVVLLLVVIVGLLVQPKETSRARQAGESSWSLTGGGRRLPAPAGEAAGGAGAQGRRRPPRAGPAARHPGRRVAVAGQPGDPRRHLRPHGALAGRAHRVGRRGQPRPGGAHRRAARWSWPTRWPTGASTRSSPSCCAPWPAGWWRCSSACPRCGCRGSCWRSRPSRSPWRCSCSS